MKTLKNLTLIIGLFSMFTLSAKTVSADMPPVMNSTQIQEVQKELDRHISFPDDARKYGITGTVKAQLVVTCEGKLDVEAIQGDPDLTRYVRNQLQKITINDISLTGTLFIVKFDFRN